MLVDFLVRDDGGLRRGCGNKDRGKKGLRGSQRQAAIGFPGEGRRSQRELVDGVHFPKWGVCRKHGSGTCVWSA